MSSLVDTPTARKDRGAFFTPVELAAFMGDWAIRDAHDSVLEPSCGDAVFVRAAIRRLRRLGATETRSQVVGYEIHADSLRDARRLLASEGADAELILSDFFEVETTRRFDAVVGNPPFIRFQGFSGRSRELAVAHARRQEVLLSGLASSWAGFVVRAAELLKVGGRLAFVLPSELLSVNYAAPVRKFLMQSFASIDVVVFDTMVFSGVQTDAIVLLADGYRDGSASHITLRPAANASAAASSTGLKWAPTDPAAKWTDALNKAADKAVTSAFSSVTVPLSAWGVVTSGTVTGANDFFALSRARAVELGLTEDDLARIFPRGLSLTSLTTFTTARWRAEVASRDGFLFAPQSLSSAASAGYVGEGERQNLHKRYKTRIRPNWWRVSLSTPPDCFVSYMSAATPRIVTNRAHAHNLNAIHGLTFAADVPPTARAALPLLALSSVSLMSAEMVGRSYGGGVLKMEPREADAWLVPSIDIAQRLAQTHHRQLSAAARLVRSGELTAATAVVDRLLESAAAHLGLGELPTREAAAIRAERLTRRLTRGNGGRRVLP